jgi:hypothetical protein
MCLRCLDVEDSHSLFKLDFIFGFYEEKFDRTQEYNLLEKHRAIGAIKCDQIHTSLWIV